MLNIKTTESVNSVIIQGILKTLEVEEKSTADGRDYVSAKVTVKVDQEISGKMVENEIPIRLFSMKLKKDGTESKIYHSIVNIKNNFTALAACPEDQPELASKVSIDTGRFEENIWIDSSGEAKTGFNISTNFINSPRGEYEEGATFELSGVVLNKTRELNENDEETGRLKVRLAVVRYGGKVDVINLIADSENAVNFIESNWEDGDTVNINGAISISQSTKVWYEEQGFGKPIKRTKTESRRELIILGGSPSGLEESFSYDANDIKQGLAERQARVEELKQKKNKAKKPSMNSTNQFGF